MSRASDCFDSAYKTIAREGISGFSTFHAIAVHTTKQPGSSLLLCPNVLPLPPANLRIAGKYMQPLPAVARRPHTMNHRRLPLIAPAPGETARYAAGTGFAHGGTVQDVRNRKCCSTRLFGRLSHRDLIVGWSEAYVWPVFSSSICRFTCFYPPSGAMPPDQTTQVDRNASTNRLPSPHRHGFHRLLQRSHRQPG